MTDKELQGKSLQHLLSITDELPQELTRDAAELATHRHFDKFSEDECWVLTTRSGAGVAVSSSEVELDQWWRCLKKQRGR